jgi:signal transduction histidine kinase
MNLVLNAADAMEGEGELLIRTCPGPDGDYLQVEIADTGPGIPEQVLARIFEPFFTTKEEGKGTGLGLSVAYGIIHNHQGRIHARNREQGGASFLIELPFRRESNERGA